MRVRNSGSGGGSVAAGEFSMVRDGIRVYSHFLGTQAVAPDGAWIGSFLDSSPNLDGNSRVSGFVGTVMRAVYVTDADSNFLTRADRTPRFSVRLRTIADASTPDSGKYSFLGFYRGDVFGNFQEIIGFGVNQGSGPQNYRSLCRIIPLGLEISDLGVPADTTFRTVEVRVVSASRIEWFIDGTLVGSRTGAVGSGRLGFAIGYLNTAFQGPGSCAGVSIGCARQNCPDVDWVDIRDRQ